LAVQVLEAQGMAMRRHLVLLLFGAMASMGASYPTPNFIVEAQNMQIAQQIGQAAEQYRKQKAIEWLGYEMPPWHERCPIQVRVTVNAPSGATQFTFDRGQVRSQFMHIEGPLDRLVSSVLPHEITHTVFAFYFRCPVPRWADEGGSVLSEDEVERNRHDKLVREVLNTHGRMIPLRRLFCLREYPGDVMALYAEGFSVANYLVATSSRQTFLGFVAHGMSGNGWDSAVRTFYHYNRVEDLEEAWLTHLRNTKRQPTLLAQNTGHGLTADQTHRVIVRQTVPPMLPAPVFRGQSEQEADIDSARRGSRPAYLPDPTPAPGPNSSILASNPGRRPTSDGWQPGGTLSYQPGAYQGYQPPSVQLGRPQFVPSAPIEAARPIPSPAPVGYPH
jgi:hypothetical protein